MSVCSSYVQLFVTSWTVAHQPPLSMEFSKQDYWSQLSFPTPGNLPNPGIQLMSLASPASAGRFFSACISCVGRQILHHCATYSCSCLVAKLCLTLCDPMDCSPPGSSVHGIIPARILEWVSISFSRESSWPKDQNCVSCISGGFFTG